MSVSVLSSQVLVLNRDWQPIRITSLAHAMKKITKGPQAKIIDPADYASYTWDDWTKLKLQDDQEVIRGVRQNYRRPKVIIVDYDKQPHQRVKFSRRMVYRRDNYQCMYCGKHLPTEELTIDHVVPRSKGGETTWTNVVLSCIDCNSYKANRTPEEAGLKLIREPYKPKFSLFKNERKYIDPDFQKFMSEMYWETPLANN